MKNKVWYKVTIPTEEQDVSIYPTEGFDGIIVETKEMDGTTQSPRMYLNENEMDLLISKMREMMNYVKAGTGEFSLAAVFQCDAGGDK
jgi:hypothetical protein